MSFGIALGVGIGPAMGVWPQRRSTSKLATIAACAVIALAAQQAAAQSGTWNVTTSGTWSDSANWLGNVVASGTGATANFTNDITSNVAVTLDAPQTITTVVFGDSGTSTSASWSLGNGGNAANVLTLSNTAGGGATLTVNALGAGASATISAAIDATSMSGAGVFTRSGVGTLTISGSLLGSLANELRFTGGTTNLTGPWVQSGKFIMNNNAIVNWSATSGTINNQYFGVGDNSSGTFNMTSGSIAHNYNGGMFIGNGGSTVGVMTISGGTFSEMNASSRLSIGAGYNGLGNGTESGTLTISGGGLYAFGGNAIKLSGSNAASRGTINLNTGGTFRLNATQVTSGSGIATFSFNGGTLQLSASNTAIFATTVTPTIGASGATVDTNGFNGTFANNAITGAGSLTKAGAGMLTLSQTSASWTGKSIITGGTLSVDNDTKLGAAPGSFVADQVNLNGGSLRWAGNATMNANRGITLTAASGTLALNSSSFTYNGRFTGAGNTLSIGGAGDIVLGNSTGTASNVNFSTLGSSRFFYNGLNALGTGTITVNPSTRLVSQSTSPGTVPNAITVLSGGGISARTSGTYTNVTLPTSGTVTFNLDDGTTTDLVIRSNQTLATGTSLTVSMNQQGSNPIGAATLSGTISGAGQLIKTGIGHLSLTGTSNTYSGGTMLSGGTLQIAGDRSLGALPGAFSVNNVTVSDSATLRGGGVGIQVATNRGITVTGSGFLSGGMTVNSRFTSGAAGSVLSIRDGENVFQNQTGAPSDVNLVLLAGGARLFFNGTNALGTGSVEVNAGANLVSNFAGSIGNAITVNNGGRLSARSAVTYTNVALPQSGTVRLNFDDQATTTLTIASPIALASGSTLTVEMLQQATGTLGQAVFSGPISGAGGLVKTGSGLLQLAGNNSYGGVTTVSLGTLLVNGTNSGLGGVTVASGAVLGGSGSLAGLTAVSGTLSPGNSPGILTLDELSLGSTSTTLIELAGTSRGSTYDGVNVLTAGGLTYGGTLALSFTSLFADNTTFNLFSFTGAPVGGLGAITTNGSYGSLTFSGSGGVWTSNEVNGQTMTFTESTGDLVIVPEPSALTIAALGMAAACWAASRRRPGRP